MTSLPDVSSGIESVPSGTDIPFMLIYSVVVLRVNDGEHTHRYRYPAKGIAETKAAIKKNEENNPPFEPAEDVSVRFDLTQTPS